jgi:hypothetical protein
LNSGKVGFLRFSRVFPVFRRILNSSFKIVRVRVRVYKQTGYLCEVNIYLGKAEALSPRETQIGMNVVLKFAERYFFSDRCICADNFFISIALCEKLWSKNLEYLGKSFPKNFF